MEVRIDVRLVGRKFLPRRRSDSTVRLCFCRCCSRLKAGLDLNETIEEQIMKHDSDLVLINVLFPVLSRCTMDYNFGVPIVGVIGISIAATAGWLVAGGSAAALAQNQ